MTGHGSKFDRMKDEAIAALLSHKSVEEAARAIGVNANTLARWMKEKEFLESMEGAKKLMYSDAIEKLREHAGAAATTILRVMVDPNTPAQAKLKAASIVLDKSEITKNFEDRLARIEALLPLQFEPSVPSAGRKASSSEPLIEMPAASADDAGGATDPAEDDEDEEEQLAS